MGGEWVVASVEGGINNRANQCQRAEVVLIWVSGF